MTEAFIPYGAYWSSPFTKWQGALAAAHPLELAAACGRQALSRAKVEPTSLSAIVLGLTIPSRSCFYGAPWVASMMGAPTITGPMVMQACATSARCVEVAAAMVAAGDEAVLVVAADKTSNGPHLVYPNPGAPGGKADAEDWVWDNFTLDPVAKNAMVVTAENVAREARIGRKEQDEVTLLRYAQYAEALKDAAAFQKRYMLRPLEAKDASGKRVLAASDGDEGIFPTTADGLAKLKPVQPEGTVTFGTQTHPADGNAGLVVATRDRARAMSRDPKVSVRIASFAQANAPKGFMPKAIVPAARKALAAARFSPAEVAIKTHNPFAVNDVLLSRELDRKPESFNKYGSSLVYGHPQAPTGLRAMIELVEELVLGGGGRGLFVGCAAGDTAAAVCLEVTSG